ncbi:DUF2851 family protein [Flavobacterium lindanitolerans]|uniref:Uncharacterized protein DUF2851 n=1 Tax=Flavobacterium lindanitolerans TaxID=428988 RepID=A0A497VE02_9FLAO|nr:DUF2851 family protein [Flavobacterium lindanitolerans]PKW29576.1 uncharacterized protein DUF2851 [Flavobacterium lindanitolerans]RLJ34923.1 uncharacterized protein DUF2851 [Flavobacterium lindanitolerans]
MKEDFLHFLWQFKKFDLAQLYTTQGEKLTIISSGLYLQKAGPDFFNAQIVIGAQKWAGNVEIHRKSSDWYLHNHETDPNYDNVILHVVWEHDMEVFRKDNTELAVLELSKFVSGKMLENYQTLMMDKTWIYCEKQITLVDGFVLDNWKERLFFERLEKKSRLIWNTFSETLNDWEALLFCLLAKNFGLNSNGETFLKMALSIPFQKIRKESFEVKNLEALFYGRVGLLYNENEDVYFQDLKGRWDYLRNKHILKRIYVDPVQFFRLRPSNFPTIRLSQLANLYHSKPNLFSKIIESKSLAEFYKIFDVSASDYWSDHYQFDKQSRRKEKKLTNAFIDLLLINTVVPLKFAYAAYVGDDISEEIVQLLSEIPAEKNIIIDKFRDFGIVANNAYETQALLQLKNEYCNKKRCLECGIGLELMKN